MTEPALADPGGAAEAAKRQAEYYSRTAGHYDAMHLGESDEHRIALSFLMGIAKGIGARSILDVGAGTGRGIVTLSRAFPDLSIVGIEPVAALREVGYAKGIDPQQLRPGDGENLPFADGSFDFVIETGVLHHVAEPEKVVAEMVRVARLGVMISDANNYGQGSPVARWAKNFIRKLGLWQALIWLQTRGKMWKWSEGDGLFYSYSVFDTAELVQAKFPRRFFANTAAISGTDLRSGAPQICLIALQGEAKLSEAA